MKLRVYIYTYVARVTRRWEISLEGKKGYPVDGQENSFESAESFGEEELSLSREIKCVLPVAALRLREVCGKSVRARRCDVFLRAELSTHLLHRSNRHRTHALSRAVAAFGGNNRATVSVRSASWKSLVLRKKFSCEKDRCKEYKIYFNCATTYSRQLLSRNYF